MKIEILPGIQVLIFGAVMYGISALVQGGIIQVPGQWILALLISISGFCIILISGMLFRAAKTTVNPMRPEQATALVVTGMYRLSRNPMYIGFFMILLGWGVYLGSIPALFLLPLFIWIMNKLYILPEESVLQHKFGNAYLEYQSRVRRWL